MRTLTILILALALAACDPDDTATQTDTLSPADATTAPDSSSPTDTLPEDTTPATDTGLCTPPPRLPINEPCEWNSQCEQFLVCENLRCSRVACDADEDCPAARCDAGFCRWYECGGPATCEMTCFPGTCQNSLCK